jgi:uncharacterized protein (TIRG00374 family)
MTSEDTHTPAVQPSRPSRWRRPSVSLVARFLAFAAVVHFLVLPQIGGTRRALGLVADLNLLVIVGAVGLEALALLSYAQLSRSLLPPGERPGLWRMFRIVLSSLAVNHVVPGGAAAGGVVQYRLMTASGADAAHVSFVMAAQSLGSAAVLNVLLWLGLIVSIPASGFQPLYATAAAVGAVLLAVVGAAVFALTRGRRRTALLIGRLAARTHRLDEARVVAAFERAADRLKVLTTDRRVAITAVGWATANWLFDAAVLWVFLAAFGHRMPIPGLLVAYCLANVLAAIPISPGGLGIIETTLVVGLVGFGAPRAVASLGVASYRLVQFWAPIPAGAVAWASLSGGRRRDALKTMTDEARVSPPPAR